MTTMLPAMRGKFGSTEFFIVTMPASQLERTLRLPKEVDGWEDLKMEERFQREVNFRRVKEHIAPYLANDPDRFFGAFIVDIYNGENVEFEPLGDVIRSVPKYYQKSASEFGFLMLEGNEIFVPLDGQHRLTAIKFAITGKDEKGKEISGLEPSIEVGADICTCIMVRHETGKARRIFNKVNRYAKATSKADNLITADDDIVAVITREIVHKHFYDRIVNFRTNTLNKTAVEFTTLSTLYEASGVVLESILGINRKIDRTSLPSKEERKILRDAADSFWEDFVSNVEVLNAPLHDPNYGGDDKRKQFRGDYVLGKPIVQLALVEAIVRLAEPEADGVRLSNDEIYARVNICDWSVENSIWQRVLMNGDRVITGQQARRFGARFIAYLLGEKLEEVEYDTLAKQYSALFDTDDKTIPERLVQV